MSAGVGRSHHGNHPAGHGGAPPEISLSAAFRFGVALNLGYTLLEAAAGLWFGSLALLTDAAHNLTDVGGLLIAWGAAAAGRLKPDARHTYGFGRATILVAILNAAAILVGVGAVTLEALDRLAAPAEVPGLPVLVVATVGIGVNIGTALLFRSHGAHDLNARGAFLHMAADGAVSAAVVASALVILATGWSVIDPLVALAVGLVIAVTALRLLREALHLTMDGVPPEADATAVRSFLASQPGVAEVHDLRMRAHSTTVSEMTAHLVMPDGHPGDAFLSRIAAELKARFGIARATLQVERGDGPTCPAAGG